jgi:HD superfamily phosphohydrolase
VFPGAVHGRYSHSLGVAHIAQKMIEHLKDTARRDRESGRRDYQPVLIDERDEKNVVLAGLMHDFGHGVYSHLFDRDFMPKILK